jgi:hypothetical protein
MNMTLTLEELAGWPYDEDDNPAQITEADIDIAAEIREDDELVEHNRREADDVFRPF